MSREEAENLYWILQRDADSPQKDQDHGIGLILGAVVAEREACAKVADNFLGDMVVRDGIAAAIRART